MKQLVILSGKGGTGKTSVAAAFAHLAAGGGSRTRAVLVDADVDAANLELVLDPRPIEEHEFIAGSVAVIDTARCSSCGRCDEVCRFDAVLQVGRDDLEAHGRAASLAYAIDPIACEGCAACVHQCPERAIRMEPQVAGRWFRSETRHGPLVHAALRAGQDNSGKLVALVRQEARRLALDEGRDLVIVDGPPGIGCPVIAAATGADLVLVVTEPSAAGIHDMDRILATAAHFRVPAVVCVNKADLHAAGSRRIEEYCREHGIDLVGRLPFDPVMTEALVLARPVTEHAPDSPVATALIELWSAVAARLSERP